jgi:hypothetical protein
MLHKIDELGFRVCLVRRGILYSRFMLTSVHFLTNQLALLFIDLHEHVGLSLLQDNLLSQSQ